MTEFEFQLQNEYRKLLARCRHWVAYDEPCPAGYCDGEEYDQNMVAIHI